MDFSGALAYLSEQNATCVLDELSDGGKGLSSHWAELYHGSLSGIITQLAMLVFGVLLNFQILLLAIFKRLYTHSTFLLLLNLVIVDICICLIPITFNISIGFAGGYSFGNSDYVRCQVCKIAAVFVMLKLLSSFNLALLSMDRFAFFFMPFNKETNHAIMAKYKLTILGVAECRTRRATSGWLWRCCLFRSLWTRVFDHLTCEQEWAFSNSCWHLWANGRSDHCSKQCMDIV